MKLYKLSWHGRVIAVQPRIRLIRSFDQRNHAYLGYSLRVQGAIGDNDREFLIGIGKAAQTKHQFRAGDTASGKSHPVMDTRTEAIEFYKTSNLSVVERFQGKQPEPPPWLGIPPELETYRGRGHRRLDAHTYTVKCRSCI
jgi:hypothetical protein